MATVVEIIVEVSTAAGSAGPDGTGPVEFRYHGLNQTGKQILAGHWGDINLEALRASTIIKFVLNTKNLTWGENTWSVDFPENADDALWIFDNKLNPAAFPKGEDEFEKIAFEKFGNRTAVIVHGRNRKKYIYNYAVAIELTKPGKAPVLKRDDPQIKNGGLNVASNIGFTQRVLVALLGITSLLLAMNIGLTIFG